MLKYWWNRGVNNNTNKCRGKNGEEKKNSTVHNNNNNNKTLSSILFSLLW